MQTKLTDLKNDKPKKEDKNEVTMAMPCCGVEAYEKYPWGTRISFDDNVIEKLKIDLSSLKIGGKGKLMAEYEIMEISRNDRMDGDGKERKSQSLGIQIQKLALSDEGDFESGFKGKGDDD